MQNKSCDNLYRFIHKSLSYPVFHKCVERISMRWVRTCKDQMDRSISLINDFVVPHPLFFMFFLLDVSFKVFDEAVSTQSLYLIIQCSLFCLFGMMAIDILVFLVYDKSFFPQGSKQNTIIPQFFSFFPTEQPYVSYYINLMLKSIKFD